MRVANVVKSEAPVISITIEMTGQQATDLAHLLGTIGGDPNVWPQRNRTFDKLWGILDKHGLTTQPNPMRYQQYNGAIVESIYLATNGPGCNLHTPPRK